jgi:ribonuclease HI
MNTPKITIYTDGAARGNPGPGGYGAVLISGKFRKELSAGFRKTTNNRMELLAVIVALEKLKFENSIVDVYTDSKYVSDAINLDWISGWQKRKFKKVKNVDLWERLIELLSKHKVNFHWVKGHAGIPENEVCDKLAVKASFEDDLQIDEEYEKSTISQIQLDK